MKTSFLFLLISLGFAVLSFGQNTYVPDDNFEQALIDLGYDTPPLNNYVPTANINTITALNVSNKNISDLTGIEGFVALRSLICYNNQLTNINLSNVDAYFSILFCGNNQLTSIDISNCAFLKQLHCENNQISNLDLSQNTKLLDLISTNNPLNSLDISSNTLLKYLTCSNNQLTSLDVSNNNDLIHLSCPNNQILSLDISNLTLLSLLNIGYNQFTSIDLSNNTALTSFVCNENLISNIDVSNNTSLKGLDCSHNNNITGLDLTNNPQLTGLRFDNCSLTNIDISINTALEGLYFKDNQITSLDVSTNVNLSGISCENNQIASLDLTNNIALADLRCTNNQLTSLDVSNNTLLYILDCAFNSITNLDVSNSPLLNFLFAHSNQLISFNVKNGNNINLGQFTAHNNPNLSCIQVDDAEWSYIHMGNKPPTAIYSVNCSSLPIVVTSPNGSEVWATGSIHNITWSEGTGTNTKIELWNSATNLKVSDIASNVVGQTYSWTIGALASGSTYKIKVIDIGNGLSDQSNTNFRITQPIAVTSPNGGEIWATGSVHNITWSEGSGTNTKIELWNSATNLKVSDIANNIVGQSWSWTIGAIANGSAYKIKVIDNFDGSTDFSNANFRITQPIAVTSPNGGEIWATGSVHNITWSEGSGTNTKIELWNSATNLKVSDIANNIVGQSYSWTIGAIANGSTYKIKVIDNGDGSTDFSNANFRIIQPVAVTSPNGSEIWAIGSVHNITWSEGAGTNTKIELWNSATNLKVSDIANSVVGQSYSWTIGAVAIGSTYKIKVIDNGAGSTDFSNANFRITQPVAVTSPNGSEIWAIGSVHNITWSEGAGTNLKIELWNSATNLKVSDIASNIVGQSYSWTIGAVAIGSTYKIKVIDSGDGSTDLSNANFTIIDQPATLTVTSPNGSEIWATGTTQAISWSGGYGTNTKIELWNSATNLKVSDISTGIVGQSYSWTIGAIANGSTYKIKVIDNVDGSIDFSNTNFRITQPIEVTSPNGSEIWATGSVHNITWAEGTGTNTKIELWNSATNLKVSDIASNIVGQTYSWTIGATAIGSTYKIKVIDNGDGSTDLSNANFTIIDQPTTLTVTAPNGSEIWATGTNHTISWTGGYGVDTKIELWNSATNLKVSDIANNVVGQSYSWTIGAIAVGSTYKIKVIDNGDGSTDFSNANFRITQPIAVTSPNGGEILHIGTVHNITWSGGSGTNTKIELWRSGMYFHDIATGIFGQSYSWTIGIDAADPGYRIKVIDNGDLSSDLSDGTFWIIPPPVEVASPNGGEIWEIGTVHNIIWSGGSGTNTKIELWNSATNLKVSDIANNIVGQSYSWTIGTIASGSTYKIKVIDVYGLSDFSDANFTIIDQPVSLTVNSPSGGEIWATGTNHTISWSGGSGTNTKIELWNSTTNLKVSDIANGVAGQSYSWTIGSIAAGSTYKIKVIDNVSGSTGLSNANFRITQAVVVVQPNSFGTSWDAGTSHEIIWSGGTGNATIELLDYSGAPTVYPVTTSVSSPYSWTIGLDIPAGSQYKIRITDAGDLTTDLSNNNFEITEYIRVTQPSLNGIQWNIGSSHAITWEDNISGPVNIYLYNSNTGTYTTIATADNDNSYNWVIPANTPIGSNYKIKVSSTLDPTVYDTSDWHFSIVAANNTFFVDVIQPSASGLIWNTGENYLISWTDNLSQNVKIDLINDATNSTTPIAASVSGSTYSWHISEALPNGSQYKIRISSITGNGTEGVSENYFTITNTPAATNIVIQHPTNTGITWLRGSSYLISWTDNVPNNNVNIILCNAAGTDIATLKSNAPGSTWVWTIPATTYPVGAYKIKVVYNDASGMSLNPFTISDSPEGAYIDVLQPDLAGITWLRGSTYFISWDDNIPGTVDIFYERTSDPTEVPVATNVTGSTYAWTVPQITEASDYWITIRSHADASKVGMSENPFAILDYLPGGTIDINQPNGGEIWTKGNSYLISWIDNFAENVKIELVNYATTTTTVLNPSAQGSTWAWTIPNTITYPAGMMYKMKISSTENPACFAESDNYFTITDQVISAVIYPNPANRDFNLQFSEEISGNYTLIFSNRFNMVVMSRNINLLDVKEINVSTLGLNDGVYILTMTSENVLITKKVIIQNY